jgi:hypothetical protein
MKKIALLLLLAGLPSLANANVLSKASFESEDQAKSTLDIYNNLIGWTGQDVGDIELLNGVAGKSSDEFNFAELDTSFKRSMLQTFNTIKGAMYDLSFDYSAPAGVSKQSSLITVFWNGVELSSFTGRGLSKEGDNWLSQDFHVMGTGHDTLSFTAAGDRDGFSGRVDDVKLVATVPEPESYILLLTGLCLLGFVSRRRKAV